MNWQLDAMNAKQRAMIRDLRALHTPDAVISSAVRATTAPDTRKRKEGAILTPSKARGAQFEYKVASADLFSAPEKQLQALCECELYRRGLAFLHLSPRARERVGWPDLTFVIGGTPFAVELKAAAGVVSEEQEACLSLMAENGWRVAVIRSIEAFLGFINQAAQPAAKGVL
jgi:hypothetical protein